MVVAISTGQKDCDFGGGCGWYLRMSLSLNAQRCCSGETRRWFCHNTRVVMNRERCSGELCLLLPPSAYSIREARKEGGPLQTSARDRWWIIPLCALSAPPPSLGPRCQNQNDRMEERSERRRSKQPPPRPRQPTAPRGPRAGDGAREGAGGHRV